MEARELWALLDRKNVMIKIPATKAGLLPIRALIAEGVNINVTLIFGLGRYREVCEAWLQGMEDRLQAGKNLDGVASVASFFLSRIDAKLDPVLTEISATHKHVDLLLGKVAVAQAKLAYQHFLHIKNGERFQELVRHGARPQRLLWASTGTKDPSYLDTWYVEALIGADTVTTLPMETLAAYREHGCPAGRLTEGLEEAQAIMDGLQAIDIDLEAVAATLEDEGIQKFRKPYEALLSSLQTSCEKLLQD
jgi:transaldolase/transaldolase/glucose-6-phosphate isomerase